MQIAAAERARPAHNAPRRTRNMTAHAADRRMVVRFSVAAGRWAEERCMTLVSRPVRFAPARVFLGLVAASDAHATIANGPKVCGYRVKGSVGFQCPIHTGANVCLTVNAKTGADCQN